VVELITPLVRWPWSPQSIRGWPPSSARRRPRREPEGGGARELVRRTRGGQANQRKVAALLHDVFMTENSYKKKLLPPTQNAVHDVFS
jgi:hypothetical protein